jgi:carbonic anhydrase
MSFSWEPFGPSRREGPTAAPAPLAPVPEPAAAPVPAREPARQLAVLTCMDCRIDPLRVLGLQLGDAVVLRNAGAQWSDDVVRALRLSRGLGVTQVQVLAHTDCAAFGGDDEAAEGSAGRTAARIRAAIPELHVKAGVLDLGTGLSRPAAARRPSD